MKKLVAMLLCLCFCSSLAACSNGNESNNETVIVTEETSMNTIECKYFDTTSGNEHFTDETIISLSIPSNYTATDQEQLLHQHPIYQIGEYKSDKKAVTIFQYNDELNFDKCLKVDDKWVIGYSEDPSVVNFYTKTDKSIIGVSISNIDKSELDNKMAVAALSMLTGTEMTAPEGKIEKKSDYAEASVENPAKVGEWISIRMYNPLSNKDEAILFSISSVHTDYVNNSAIDAYNNLGQTKQLNDEIINFTMHPKAFESGYDDIIYNYSIYYPTTWTSENGVITNPEIPISLCNANDTSTAIEGEINLNKTIHDFNDLYKKTAKVGEDYTDGIGTYAMVRNIASGKYLIKLETADGPRYFTP